MYPLTDSLLIFKESALKLLCNGLTIVYDIVIMKNSIIVWKYSKPYPNYIITIIVQFYVDYFLKNILIKQCNGSK